MRIAVAPPNTQWLTELWSASVGAGPTDGVDNPNMVIGAGRPANAPPGGDGSTLTPLMKAAQGGDLGEMRRLLLTPIDIHIPKRTG